MKNEAELCKLSKIHEKYAFGNRLSRSRTKDQKI
jgi:hypothetical protein